MSSGKVSQAAMTIGGRPVRHASRLFDVLNPFDGSVCGQAPNCTRDELDQAVAAARAAQPAWAARPWAERQQALLKCADALNANVQSLARLLTTEQGKGLPQSVGEVKGSIAWLKTCAQYTSPDKVLRDSPRDLVEQRYRALGVVGALVSWNFPLLLIHFKLAQALLAGCAVVLKPSEHTPLTALELGRLYAEILPAGVFSVVSGDNKDLGEWLVAHPGVDKVSFTGSTATGKAVMRGAAASLKRVTLELGGNDAAVVMPDADIAQTAQKLFMASFLNSGQVCIACKRVYAHEDIFEALCAALAKCAAAARFGDGLQDGVVFGPLNNEMQYNKVRGLLADALDRGARTAHGALPPPLGSGHAKAKGFMFPPVVLRDVTEDMPIVKEEQFGPVLPVLKWRDEDDVVRRVNDSEYALGASVWTADVDKGAALAARLEAGTVWVNDHGSIIDDVPFGGAKSSGLGHEGGQEGLLAFMQMHVLKVAKSKQAKL